MARKKTGATANHFALLDGDDPGDTRLADMDSKKQQQAAPASLTEEFFGGAYPSAWKVIKNREKQQCGGGCANARDGATTAAGGCARAGGSKKGAQGKGTKQLGGRHAHGNGAAAVDGEAPAPRLYDLAQFPSLN